MAGSMADAFGKLGQFKEKAENVKKENQQNQDRKKQNQYDKFSKAPNRNNEQVMNGDRNFRGGTGLQEATAPYNFVPLAGKAVNSPLGVAIEDNQTYGHYIDEQGKLTGFIDLEFTTLTPLCINDSGKFYSPNGKPCIPGSTLRGMFKNYLKIVSCGTMRAGGNEDLTSRHLYYRGLASPYKEFRNQYASKMTGIKKVVIDGVEKTINDSNASAGFLAQLEDNSYVIYPADFKAIPYPRKPNPRPKNDRDKWLYHIPDSLRGNKEGKIEVFEDCVNCHTGDMYGKGHFYRLSNVAWKNPMMVDEEIIADYRADKNRIGMNLLAKEKSIDKSLFARGHHFKHLVPCFYLEADGKVLHFGYGKYYRIPYDKAIEDHIPLEMKDEKIVDFAEAIFGRKEDFAGRVFFEDAVCQSGELLPREYSHNLMEPRPTSFQLYLEMQGRKAQHYDEDTNIRGYKLYWHQGIGARDWHRGSTEKEVKGTVQIEPIAKNTVFKASIRFENLSEIELGALLATLKLADGGCFKLGMGKPIGMGSIKTVFKLHLYDLQTRYSGLFKNEDWLQCDKVAEVQQYEKAFSEYMQKETKTLGIEDGYKKSLEALAIMMNWDAKPAREKLAYMPIGDRNDKRYQNRVPLPTPEEVIKGIK